MKLNEPTKWRLLQMFALGVLGLLVKIYEIQNTAAQHMFSLPPRVCE